MEMELYCYWEQGHSQEFDLGVYVDGVSGSLQF